MQNHSANQNQTLKEKNRQADMEKQMRTGGNSCPPPVCLLPLVTSIRSKKSQTTKNVLSKTLSFLLSSVRINH
jgi:hypothetical protein